MTVLLATGFETGDTSEIISAGAGSSVQTGTVHRGTYALKQAGPSSELAGGVMGTLFCFRAYFLKTDSASATPLMFSLTDAASGNVGIYHDISDHKLYVQGGGTFVCALTGTIRPVTNGVWHLLECAIDGASGGIVKVWIDGVPEIDITHTGSLTWVHFYCFGLASPNEWFFDDLLAVDALLQLGATEYPAPQSLL